MPCVVTASATIKLNQDVPLDEIESMLSEANQWVQLVGNNKEDSADLSPAAVTGLAGAAGTFAQDEYGRSVSVSLP